MLRVKNMLRGLRRDERGIESIEFMMTGLVLCAIVIFFAQDLTDPLIEAIFDVFDTVNAD